MVLSYVSPGDDVEGHLFYYNPNAQNGYNTVMVHAYFTPKNGKQAFESMSYT